MDTLEYLKLSQESHTSGDEFYRCVSAWLKSKSAGVTPESCSDIAAKYQRALRKELVYLETRAKGERREERIERCKNYLKYLESQMDLLQSNYGD